VRPGRPSEAYRRVSQSCDIFRRPFSAHHKTDRQSTQEGLIVTVSSPATVKVLYVDEFPRGMSKYETVIHSVDNGIHKISLNRPKVLNAINTKMLEELGEILTQIRNDDSARVVIVKGEGGNFCSGADLKEGLERSKSNVRRELNINYIMTGWEVFERLETLQVPTIAQISGYCLGGGAEMMLRCDIKLASDDSKFGFPEIRSGVFPAFGGTQLLPRYVGLGKAKMLILTGEILDAKFALSIGLVDFVIPASEIEDRVGELALKLRERVPIAFRYAKELIYQSQETPRHARAAVEVLSAFKNMGSADIIEGFRAFGENRKPNFQGR